MTQSHTNLLTIVDTLQAEGKAVKFTKLPSASKRNRKSQWTLKNVKDQRQKVSA